MKKYMLIIFISLALIISSCSRSNKSGGEVAPHLSEDMVVPVYPEMGTAITSTSVTLKWGKVDPPKGTTFILRVGNDPDDMKVIAELLTGRTYRLSVEMGKYYFWQVTAVNGSARLTGELSLFKVSSRKPLYSIDLISPEANEVVHSSPILLKWKSKGGHSVTYTLYMGDSVDDMRPIASDITSTTFSFTPYRNGYFFWKVTGKDDGSAVVESPIGFFKFEFNISNPILISPDYGMVVTDKVVNFWWKKATGATSYNLYLSNYPDHFAMEIRNILGNRYSLVIPSGNSGYLFWKVEAVDPYGGTSESSLGWFVKYSYLAVRRFKYVTSSIEGDKGGDICAIDDYNRVWCWGANTYRQLGVDFLMDIGNHGSSLKTFFEEVISTSPRLLPFPEGYSYKEVAVGTKGVYAITNEGELWHLKLEKIVKIYFGLAPHRIGEDHIWSHLKGNFGHYCAVDENNQLWCWGENYKGEIGSPTLTEEYTEVPVKVSFPTDFHLIQYDMGKQFTCAYGRKEFSGDAVVMCWGDNSSGQLTRTNYDYYPAPLTIEPLQGISVKLLRAGSDDACVITKEGILMCWGGNEGGKISSALPERVYQPYEIVNPLGLRWIEVDPGSYNTCAIDEDKNLWCWGTSVMDERDYSGYGSMMTTAIYLSSPTIIKRHVQYNKLISTPLARCGLTDDGKLFCWGDRLYGVMGDGYRLDAKCSSPYYEVVENPDGRNWKEVNSGKFSMCAIDEDNQLWCWGKNEFGVLGIGNEVTTVARGMPVEVTASGVKGWKYVTRQLPFFINYEYIYDVLWGVVYGNGVYDIPTFRCALSLNNKLYCWGDNEYGELGIGSSGGYISYPVQVSGEHKWLKVSAGVRHICAIDEGHHLWCWGDNSHYELGVTDLAFSPVPIRVNYPEEITWTDVKSIWDATCALSSAGKLYCWGWSGSGVTGFSDDVTMPTPVPHFVGKTVVKIANTFSQICALENNGEVECTGRDLNGLSVMNKPAIVDYWTDIQGGILNFCATDQDGSIWCWGDPATGLFHTFKGDYIIPHGSGGYGVRFYISSPQNMAFLDHNRSLAPGLVASCYIDRNGSLFCGGRMLFVSVERYAPVDDLPPHIISDLRAALGTRFRWEPIRVQFAQKEGDSFFYNNYFGTLLQGY